MEKIEKLNATKLEKLHRVRRFTQKYATDYEPFCPVVKLESIGTLITLSVQYGLELHQVNINTAFLNGELEEEVYMRQPEGFVAEGREHLVCRLKKSLYGLECCM